MALHDILIAFCIISELRRWNYTTPWTMWNLQWPQPCPRSCPASPTIHCHTSTFPSTTLPGHFSLEARQSMLYQIKKDPSLFFLISVKVSYRELQIMFYYQIIFMNQPNIAENASLLLTQSGILRLLIFLFRSSCSASSSGARF